MRSKLLSDQKNIEMKNFDFFYQGLTPTLGYIMNIVKQLPRRVNSGVRGSISRRTKTVLPEISTGYDPNTMGNNSDNSEPRRCNHAIGTVACSKNMERENRFFQILPI